MTKVNENLAQFGTFMGKVGYVPIAPIIGVGRLTFVGALTLKHAVYRKVADIAIDELEKQQAARECERENKVNASRKRVKKSEGVFENLTTRFQNLGTRVNAEAGELTDAVKAAVNDVAITAGKKLQGIVAAELEDQTIRGVIELIPGFGGAYYAFVYKPKADIFSAFGKTDDVLGYSRVKNILEAEAMIDKAIKKFAPGYNPWF